jgi:hypothetical protein
MDQHRGVSAAVTDLLMPRENPSVASTVASATQETKKPADDDGFSLENLARPIGLEPTTSRSGI